MQKYTERTIETGRLLTKMATDTLNWSNHNYAFRVRMKRDYLFNPIPYRHKEGFGEMIKSKSTAKVFHGYLEGDYKLATSGFYTNNARGIGRLVKRYPEIIDSVQTHDQYMFAVQLSNFLYDAGRNSHE